MPVLALHTADYTWVWLVLSAVALGTVGVVGLMIDETKPAAECKPWPGWLAFGADIMPCHGGLKGRYLGGCGLWCAGSDGTAADRKRVRVLRFIMVSGLLTVFFEGVLALKNNVMLGPMHFDQKELVYVSWANKLAIMLGAPGATVVVPRLGAFRALIAGYTLKALSYLLFTAAGHLGPVRAFPATVGGPMHCQAWCPL
eukprot:SAG22_NODE_5259_length_1051_cov_1.127101_1_plen_198_part_01